MPYGKIKALALANGLKEKRGYDLLEGNIEVTEMDEAFIYACFDIALARKNRLNKIKSF